MNRSNSINLLFTKDSSIIRQGKWLKITKLIASLFIAALAVSFIALIFINRKFSTTQINKETGDTLRTIAALHKKEEKLVIANSRLKDIKEILGARLSYHKDIKMVLDGLTPNIAVDQLSIEKGKVLVSISSNSLLSINSFINNLLDLGKKKEITAIMLDSFRLDQKGERYIVSLSVSL